MIGRALDANNDLILRQGRFTTVRDGAEVVQHVRTRLQFYLEEWFLDTTAGTPYFQQIFVKPANLANVESILKQRILQTPGVARLLEFTMDYRSNTDRRLFVTFQAETIYNEIINDEVTING